MAGLVPTNFDVNVHLDDTSIFEIGLVIYIAIVAYHLLGKKK